MGKVRIAIVGVGNCASSLVQGIAFYAGVAVDADVPGLMHVDLGGYHVGDIEVVAAFDVAENKVGQELSRAILAPPNNTEVFAAVAAGDVIVERGPTMDGLGKYQGMMVEESPAEPVDVAAALRRHEVDVMVCYLPVGSEQAAKWYAEQALAAGCALVNCIPVFIASDPSWRARFEDRGLPLVGDDIKSQVGATILHRAIINLFRERGVRVDRTYQLNFGGNTDFANMLERERLESKKVSKTRAVTSQLGAPLSANDVHVGPSDHVPWLTDRKWAYIRVRGHHFRQRAAQLRAEVGGVGFAEFGRRGDRRHPLRQTRAGSRHRWRADGGVQLSHEEPAGAVHRPRGAPEDRGFHSWLIRAPRPGDDPRDLVGAARRV